MSKQLSFQDHLSFSNDDLVAAEAVVKEYADQLDSVTRHYVQGAVEEYDSPIHSYKIQDSVARISIALAGNTEHDIQTDLGKQGYDISKFEFYLTANKLPDYKFRILFFEYGIGGYPVNCVVEQGIANELNGRNEPLYTYTLGNRIELENMLDRIFSTKRIVDVIQELINASIIEEKRNTEDQSTRS